MVLTPQRTCEEIVVILNRPIPAELNTFETKDGRTLQLPPRKLNIREKRNGSGSHNGESIQRDHCIITLTGESYSGSVSDEHFEQIARGLGFESGDELFALVIEFKLVQPCGALPVPHVCPRTSPNPFAAEKEG